METCLATQVLSGETQSEPCLSPPSPPPRPRRYILRKLCFSILPEGTTARERFVAESLALPTVNCQQRECVKDDLVEILHGICRMCPALARIPGAFCHKD